MTASAIPTNRVQGNVAIVHRYYDPNTGRYLTPDPLGVQSEPSLYSYAAGNPLRFADAAGLFTFGFGVQGILGFGPASGGGVLLVVDDDFNFGVAISWGPGVLGPYSYSGSVQFQGTTADTIWDLTGFQLQLGGSGQVGPFMAGGEGLCEPTLKYGGVNVNVPGIGIPKGELAQFEMHLLAETTVVIPARVFTDPILKPIRDFLDFINPFGD